MRKHWGVTEAQKEVWKENCNNYAVLYTAPHVLLDYPESRWVTNCHIVRPPEWQLTQMCHKLSHGLSTGLQRNKSWLLSREGDPVESTGLDSSGVKNGSGVQRGVSGGIRRTGPLSRNIQHTYLIYVWWTVPDCAGLDSSGVQRGLSGGIRRTVLSWTLLESARQDHQNETGIHWNPPEWIKFNIFKNSGAPLI